ncbi:MAG: hypothetical protein ACRCVX_12540 [Shewanella sp.]
MIWALRLLGIGKSLLSWGRSALRWAFTDWRHIALIAGLVLSGYFWLQAGKYHRAYDRAVVTLEARNRTISDMVAASEAAEAAQIALNQQHQDRYEANKEKSDANHKIALEAAGDATSRFIAANRMSGKSCRGESGGANPASQGADTPVPETMSAVAVMDEDVRRCGEVSVYAMSAYEWAQSLIADGVAE